MLKEKGVKLLQKFDVNRGLQWRNNLFMATKGKWSFIWHHADTIIKHGTTT